MTETRPVSGSTLLVEELVGIEAIVPINRASGTGVGVLAQLHLYLDDMFPTTIGKPLFGTAAPPQKPFP